MPPPPKNESAPAAAAGAAKAPAKDAAAEAPAAAAAAAPSAGRGGIMAWVPVIAVVLLAPVATWATVEFVVLPRLQKKIAAGPAPAHAEGGGEAEHAPAAESGGHGKGKEGKGKENGGPPGYEFQNVVVNLSGTMGTRYLKTNVFIVSKDPKIKEVFDGDKPRLTDITQSVLMSLTLADIEEIGARNVIRAKLVNAYNEALRRKVVEEVYLTDFVVQ
jgi:flagellar FliL protein